MSALCHVRVLIWLSRHPSLILSLLGVTVTAESSKTKNNNINGFIHLPLVTYCALYRLQRTTGPCMCGLSGISTRCSCRPCRALRAREGGAISPHQLATATALPASIVIPLRLRDRDPEDLVPPIPRLIPIPPLGSRASAMAKGKSGRPCNI